MTQYIEIAISHDGGQTYGDWTLHPIPAVGEYKHPYVIRRRCGLGRNFVVKTRFTEPRNIVILAAEIQPDRQ